MTKWEQWGIWDGHLHLPDIQKGQTLDLSAVFCVESRLCISVEEDFATLWLNGPADESEAALLSAVKLLGKTFSKFIIKGQGNVGVFQKTSQSDLVTEVDLGIEMLLRIWIRRFYPDHKIIGEEGFKDEIAVGDTVWYLDPVDGTNNYASNGKNVAIHIGCVRAGKPYVSFVGLPFYETYYYGSLNNPTVKDTTEGVFLMGNPVLPADPVIGTEYFSTNKRDLKIINGLLGRFNNSRLCRTKSIGVNLVEFLEGRTNAFYKRNVKLWDIIAPMGIISLAFGDQIDAVMYVNTESTGTYRQYSPFSDDKDWVTWINNCHRDHCRIGFFILYPTSQPQLSKAILEESELL